MRDKHDDNMTSKHVIDARHNIRRIHTLHYMLDICTYDMDLIIIIYAARLAHVHIQLEFKGWGYGIGVLERMTRRGIIARLINMPLPRHASLALAHTAAVCTAH